MGLKIRLTYPAQEFTRFQIYGVQCMHSFKIKIFPRS